ncbi:VOC family protein [Qipengyuania qiaonensis]|uniref:VOC family protein n=1 Tax=Qipengyuania qiaonensis TaxID=2867240 RepID=A0ABS7J4L1_9SPHN|nr:VOC family protein [Qipengyuania qiaonensis]MBX7482273.1 VOC family protein [Qipengyuania qiaonensis]
MPLTFVPYFAYENAAEAIDYLERCFGFATGARYDGEDGAVMHAELTFRGGAIMLGSAQGGPGDPKPSHGTYVVVEDVDAHFAKAEAAGVRVVYPPEDTEFGSRRWRAQDSEGYEWSFGTYAPNTGDG